MESDQPPVERLRMPAKWTHPLPFMMVSEDKFGTEEELEPELVDLMSISDISYKGPYRHYFPSKYKPSDPVGHQLLAKDLRSVGLPHGVTFARQGGKKGSYPMVCQCGVFYRAVTKSGMETENVAGFKYKANINAGPTLPKRKRRRTTKRPIKGYDLTCKARLTFYADRKHDRFSIHAYNGQRYHNDNHQPKSTEMPFGTKDLSVETVKLGQSMQSTRNNRSSIRNLVHQQSGVALNCDPSPIIIKSEHQYPWPLVTPESPVIQSTDVLPPPVYNGQHYYNDHHQLKSKESPIGIKDLSVKTAKLGQPMQSTKNNRSSIRNLVHHQSGVALNCDPSPIIIKSEHQYPSLPVTPESPVIQSPDVLPPVYNGQHYRNDHNQLKSKEIPIGIKDLRVETAKLDQPMQSAYNDISLIRSQFRQQYGVTLHGDSSPTIEKSEHRHLGTPESPVIQSPDLLPPPAAYNGQRYQKDHPQLKSTEMPIGIKNLRVETVKLGHSMQSTEINLSSMRNRFCQQYGVALKGDPSPIITKSELQHPWPIVTPESLAIQSLDVLPPPVPSQDDCFDDQHQDGEVSEPLPNDSTQKITFSKDDSRVKERATYGQGFEEFASCLMLLGREVMSGAYACPTSREQMRDFSSQTRAIFSKRQPPTCQEALSQIKRVLLPNEQELQPCDASVETKAQHNTRKRRAEEVYRKTK